MKNCVERPSCFQTFNRYRNASFVRFERFRVLVLINSLCFLVILFTNRLNIMAEDFRQAATTIFTESWLARFDRSMLTNVFLDRNACAFTQNEFHQNFGNFLHGKNRIRKNYLIRLSFFVIPDLLYSDISYYYKIKITE